jgi:Zn-dependent protease with chaperone function
MGRWITLLALLMVATGAAASELSGYDAELDSVLRGRSPQAETLFARANAARDHGQPTDAIALYDRVTQLVPDFWPAWRRRAGVDSRLGNRQSAIARLRWLRDRDSTAYTLGGLADALVGGAHGDTPSDAELREARELVTRALAMMPGDASIRMTAFGVSMASADTAMMRQSSTALTRLAPGAWQSWASLAIYERTADHLQESENALRHAASLGMPDAAETSMQQELSHARADDVRRALPLILLFVLIAWVVAFAVLLAVGLVLSAATLRAASSPPDAAGGVAVGLAGWLRRTYAAVLWLSCLFYYVSIPIVLLLVLAIGGGILFLMLQSGHVFIQLTIALILGMLVTVWAVLRGLFTPGHDGDPGERLDLSEQPRLRELLERVAAKIGTSPVDEVYLTPATDVAVMERGGMGRQLRGRTERCLILGVGVLDGMTVGQLQAVLAHEYGHFINRDTAGGGFAFSVRRALYGTAQRLAEGGAATWYNPAWQFLRGFHAVFMRISQGASRLQEVLADRWAAGAYGAEAFSAGLRHVVATSVRFHVMVNATLSAALRQGVPLPNLYQAHVHLPPGGEEDLEKRIEQALAREPDPLDSHPAPNQRFAWVSRLPEPVDAAGPEAAAPAWSLLEGRTRIEEDMTRIVRGNVEQRHEVKFASTPEPAPEEPAAT